MPKSHMIVAPPWVFIPMADLSSVRQPTPGTYLRTSDCIINAPCGECGAGICEPCKTGGKYRTKVCGMRKYSKAPTGTGETLTVIDLRVNTPNGMIVRVSLPAQELSAQDLERLRFRDTQAERTITEFADEVCKSRGNCKGDAHAWGCPWHFMRHRDKKYWDEWRKSARKGS